MRDTHSARIERMLRTAGPRGVCATQFLSVYMPTYSQRIGELKRSKGLNITTHPCDNEFHGHESRQIVYVLEADDGS